MSTPARRRRIPTNLLTVSSLHDKAPQVFAQIDDLRGLERLVLPSAVLDITRRHLQAHGAVQEEGALCWAGTPAGPTALVTSALLFTATGDGGGIHVSSAQSSLLYAHCHSRGLTLLAQVHSHPGRAYHSHPDQQLPHSAEVGFLSIVVPYFGHCAFDRFGSWAVFEQVAYERWREWSLAEKGRRMQVLDSIISVP
jgi:proteasome lid subunit RPN8/RPN11